MDLGIRTETFSPSEDQTWLGSAHGTNECDSLTLDDDVFLALAAFEDGIVPSGVVLGRVTASGLYVPYTDAATHGVGSDTARYHLFTTKAIRAGGQTSGAGFWHGEVLVANLPADNGLTAAGRADLPHIRYVD